MRPSQLALPVGIVGIVLLLVVPLPAALLDLLIAFNITASICVLLVTVYVRRPLEFSVFPSLILVLTLLRLGLNVSATRPAPLVMTANWMTTRIRKMTRPMTSDPPTTKCPNESMTLPA